MVNFLKNVVHIKIASGLLIHYCDGPSVTSTDKHIRWLRSEWPDDATKSSQIYFQALPKATPMLVYLKRDS